VQSAAAELTLGEIFGSLVSAGLTEALWLDLRFGEPAIRDYD
jgi:hypothetical protein